MNIQNRCFWAEIRKIKYTSVNPSFTVKKRGLRGSELYWHVFMMNCNTLITTVDSRYLEVLGNVWNTSRYPYLDISDLQNWGKNKSNNHISQRNVIWRLQRCIENIVEKRRNCSFCCLLLEFYVKTGTRFSLRDKWFFEISEIEWTRVDCISKINY